MRRTTSCLSKRVQLNRSDLNGINQETNPDQAAVPERIIFRILQQEKRRVLLRQLEEATRITTYLHSQLRRCC